MANSIYWFNAWRTLWSEQEMYAISTYRRSAFPKRPSESLYHRHSIDIPSFPVTHQHLSRTRCHGPHGRAIVLAVWLCGVRPCVSRTRCRARHHSMVHVCGSAPYVPSTILQGGCTSVDPRIKDLQSLCSIRTARVVINYCGSAARHYCGRGRSMGVPWLPVP